MEAFRSFYAIVIQLKIPKSKDYSIINTVGMNTCPIKSINLICRLELVAFYSFCHNAAIEHTLNMKSPEHNKCPILLCPEEKASDIYDSQVKIVPGNYS